MRVLSDEGSAARAVVTQITIAIIKEINNTIILFNIFVSLNYAKR